MSVKTANISLTLGVGAMIPSIAQQIEGASIVEATAQLLDVTEDDILQFAARFPHTTDEVCEGLKSTEGMQAFDLWLRSSSRR